MRDIRSDLQQRASLCEDQIRIACAQFEHMVQQLHIQRDERISDLKSALSMIERLMLFEESLMDNVVTLETAEDAEEELTERLRAVNG